MQWSGGHQELYQVTASPGDRIGATKAGVDDLICVSKFVVGGVQPVQTEYIRTRTGRRDRVAWCRESDEGGKRLVTSDAQPVEQLHRQVETVELGDPNAGFIYNRWVLEASEGEEIQAQVKVKQHGPQ